MKILFDHQIFEIQRFGGISRYFYELMNEFDSIDRVEYDVSISYSDNEYIKKLPAVSQVIRSKTEDFLPGYNFLGKKKLFGLKNRIFHKKNVLEENKNQTIRRLQNGDFDVFHPTYFDDYFLEYLGEKPFVITIFDMIHELYPEYFSLSDKETVNKQRLLLKAHKILAISENTKKDILRFYGGDADKIMVTHLGNSLLQKSHEEFDCSNNYLLYVGRRDIYKNFYFMLNSIRDILLNNIDLKLVCSGPSFTTMELRYFKNLGIDQKLIHKSVSDEDLSLLYSKALAFIFPSLYEGFGLPILEAFSCGCPVLASRTSSLIEIGGNAAVYFDPKDVQSIQQNVLHVISDERKRQKMIDQGYKRLSNFSWSITAYKTVKLYESIWR